MRDIVQGLNVRFCADVLLLCAMLFKDLVYAFMLMFVFMRDIVQGLSVRFSVNVCFYARYYSKT
jgi:hypothetical protein